MRPFGHEEGDRNCLGLWSNGSPATHGCRDAMSSSSPPPQQLDQESP